MKIKIKFGLVLVAIIVAVVLTSGCIQDDVKDIKMFFPMSGGFTLSPIDENI